jgi:hypothetical protein
VAIDGQTSSPARVADMDYLKTEELKRLRGYSILVEEGGRMVILITDWPSREDCLTYHASRIYRQFVASTQHMLVGDYVVKVFANKTA